jgi:hypothetical protein
MITSSVAIQADSPVGAGNEGSATGDAPFLSLSGHLDGVHRTGVLTGAAIGAEIGIDYPNVPLFGDSADGTAIVAGTTVDTFVSDMIGHRIHLLCSGMRSLHIQALKGFIHHLPRPCPP